jgi:hypothetical protein
MSDHPTEPWQKDLSRIQQGFELLAAGRMVPRAEYEASRQANRDKMDQQQAAWDARFSAEIRPLEAKIESLGRTNWPLYWHR